MICPHCKKHMNAWNEPGQGTAYWCTSVKDDKVCGYSVFEKEEEEKPDPWAVNERMYWRAKLGL